MHRLRRAGAALAAASLSLLAGCGGATAVAPAADLSAPPCSLVPDGELAGLGLTGPDRATGQPAPSCSWDTAGSGGGAAGFSVTVPTVLFVAAQPGAYDAALDQLRAGGALTEDPLDGRRAATGGAGGACLAVVDTGSGALSVVSGATPDPCGAARRILAAALRTATA
ncbi:DUF3558 family protein [Pseudonocardia spirodelae]|uniref:DUF3558 family protein n=1 Tax=Pseudonocardia spirodelae TaxID=3133431 RepID=A0ABU8T3T3_9PSEU